MKRQIIILFALLAFFAGPVMGEECCEPQTRSCDGPPWSSAGCEEYRCGEGLQLGFLRGGWTIGAIELVIKSEGPIEVDFTWVPSQGGEQLGTRQFYLEGGTHSFPKLDVLKDIFNAKGIHVGGLLINWRSCGESMVYADGWAERAMGERTNFFGQRSYLHQQLICPFISERTVDDYCTPAGRDVPGCYELPVAPGTGYVRAHFLSTSQDSWQTLYVDGNRVDVNPLDPQYPELTGFNFIPSGSLVEVCYGGQPPWSGGDWEPACVWSSFEGVDADTKRRLSVPLRPLVLLP